MLSPLTGAYPLVFIVVPLLPVDPSTIGPRAGRKLISGRRPGRGHPRPGLSGSLGAEAISHARSRELAGPCRAGGAGRPWRPGRVRGGRLGCPPRGAGRTLGGGGRSRR